jgi:hypothetical protein
MAVVELFEHIAVFVGFTLESADAVPETEAAVADVPAVDARYGSRDSGIRIREIEAKLILLRRELVVNPSCIIPFEPHASSTAVCC